MTNHNNNNYEYDVRPHALSLIQAAHYLGLSDDRTVVKMVRRGQLKAIKINGRLYRVPISALDDLLNGKN